MTTMPLRIRWIAASLLAFAAAARADTIQFDPDGPSPVNPSYTINGLGFGPGNALAMGFLPGGALTVGSTFTVYYQSHVTNLSGPLAPPAIPGLNSIFQITEVAQLEEVVTSVTATSTGTTATFQLVANANNRLNIYENNAVVFNDAAGTGFTAGTIIASLTPTNLISSSFQNSTAAKGFATFNQTGAGNTDATGLAATGSGGTQLGLNVNSFNPAFFQSPITASLFNSSLSAVFDAVSPSLLFTSPNGGASFAPNIGAINGITGPDVQFQFTGITQSFNAVPEPSSFALACAGGLACAGYARRRLGRPTPAS
jgi:hypothetical protein